MAERTGVTIRALRYYDKIGLLPPGAVSPAGYRLYGPAELERLQQILFFRELEFPLAEIKAILASPAYDRTAALTAQRALLRAKRDRLDGLLRLVEAALKGETTMEMAFTAPLTGRSTRRNAGPTPGRSRPAGGILRPGRKTRRDSNPARRQPGGLPRQRRKS